MNIGIVGHESAKFTPAMRETAKEIILDILYLQPHNSSTTRTLVSGGCHLGGIDVWAEEMADELAIPKIIHKPKRLQWSGGYRERNLLIARDSDIVHCIVVAGYHSGYHGMKFKSCYHCKTDAHVKSGGCWTALRAKKAEWHVIPLIE